MYENALHVLIDYFLNKGFNLPESLEIVSHLTKEQTEFLKSIDILDLLRKANIIEVVNCLLHSLS